MAGLPCDALKLRGAATTPLAHSGEQPLAAPTQGWAASGRHSVTPPALPAPHITAHNGHITGCPCATPGRYLEVRGKPTQQQSGLNHIMDRNFFPALHEALSLGRTLIHPRSINLQPTHNYNRRHAPPPASKGFPWLTVTVLSDRGDLCHTHLVLGRVSRSCVPPLPSPLSPPPQQGLASGLGLGG